MNCPNCDKNINEKSAFCPYCGFNLKQQAGAPSKTVDKARKTELATFDNQNRQFHRRFGWLMFFVAIAILGISLAIYYSLCPHYYDITYYLNIYYNDDVYYETYYSGFEKIDWPTPSRSGYRFLGWYTSPDCKKETLFSGYEYQDKRADKDLVLYARWV